MEKDDRFSSPPPPAIDFSFAKAPSFKPRSQQNQADKPESTRSTPGIFSGPSFSPAERVKYSSLRAEVRPPRSSPLQRSAELSAPAALPAAIPTDTKHVSFPSFRTQQHAAVSSSTPEKPEDPTLPSLHSNRGQFGGSAIELPSPLMKIPPSNSLSYSTMSTPSTKERLLQRKRQSMGSRNIDSPMSPSPHIQPLSSSNHGFPLLTGTSQAQLTHHQNETRLNLSGTCLPDALTPNTAIANVQRKQEPPSSRHTSLARDSNSIAEAGSSGNRSLSHVPPESNPRIGLAFDMIKNMEEENVRLKADVHELSSRLESVQAEADGLSAKNKALQHRSKEAVETAAEALDANYKELQVLKAQCASQTTALEELKAAKSDFGHLREHVQASLAEIRPLIEVSDEALGQSTIARQIVSDIRNEVQTVTGESERKQHVVDLLREQLMSCTGDLSEARDRVLALEMELSKSRMTLDKTVDEVNMATSKISVLANELKGQQHETISALTRAGELQASLTTAEAEILDLRTKFQDSDALNHKLRTDYAVLQQTHQQTANEASRIPNLEAQLQSLSAAEATLKSKDEFISDLQTRLASSSAIEAEVKARDNTIAELRALLNSAEASERANQARIATLERAQSKLELVAAENVELQKAAERSRVLETNLVSTKKELETEKAIRIKAMRDAEVAEQQKSSLDQALQSMQDKLQRSNTRYEISEQRRVDQVEDLNNRIVTYETQLTTARENLSTYSSQVASLSASLAEIRLVVDKREAEAARLQDVVRTHASTNAEQTATITQLRAELKEQSQSLKSVESLHTTHQARVVTLERELRESGERLAEATTKLQASEAEISSLKAEAQAPRQDDEVNQLHAEVESVRKRAEAAEAKIAGQEEGFKTMVTRFRAREQLSDLETSVIRDVVPLVRAQCQTELLTRINEIKGRDTTISKLTTRIAQLEAQLDKALKGSEAAEVSLQNGTSGTGGGFQPLEVSTPLSDPPVPDADQVTTDSTPPSPPPTTRPISYAVPQGVPGRHYGSSRPAAAIARHRFTELNKPSLSSEDAIQGASSDDIAHSKAQGPGVRKVKRTHDDMEYDDEIEEDEDENVMPLKSAASKTRTTKSTRRPSVQGKPPVAPSLATGANNAGASKTRGKKRR